jgi:hypothetical protein
MADRKISDLTALTTPASGDFLPIVDISEAAAASKNKRITIEELFRGVPLGTAAAPSIAIEGDEDTGVFSPGADQLAVATNGTERARIDSAGLVGIGTSAPTEKLTINGNVAFNTNDQFIKFNSFYGSPFTGSMGSILAFNSAYGLEVAAINFYQTAGNLADILFRTGSAGSSVERMRIDSSGKVGIGTTSPSAKLEVVGGNIRLDNNQGVEWGGVNNYIYGNESTDFIAVATNGNERARIDTSGRLLVGASADSGGALLQVNGDRIRVATAKTPASAADTGTAGEICWDADYIYVCTATNTWNRSAIATW